MPYLIIGGMVFLGVVGLALYGLVVLISGAVDAVRHAKAEIDSTDG